ncbi:Hydroxymethylglutaryl-coenzyme A reductase [Dictyocaulus viviparus]|uniref:3-hydroxy-3-methylglutaryl-coenzyme A reductase n=1 Tax=Dictyocaulus viviparus TaxID=29172 RepID=A0A0D8XV37_DICVI|nr:Hydroxymethylglutaryl-coenzyme A reductase [Dictyocaulus viviparus]
MSRKDRDVRSFIDSLDVSKSTWKDDVERWILMKIESVRLERRTTHFNIGEECKDYNAIDLSSVSDASTQTAPDDDPQTDAKTASKSLDDISREWNEGKVISAYDALRLVKCGIVKCRELESRLNAETAIFVRRSYVAPGILKHLPYQNYDYKYVTNSCCENVIGYMPIPLGVAGPITINGREFYIPMATTEGALVASTNRGCSAIKHSGGVSAHVIDEKMTRAPVAKFPSASEALKLKTWIDVPENFARLKAEFESTSRFAQLRRIDVAIDGNLAFIRFVASTGDAMGMNMVSKGSSLAMNFLKQNFPTMRLLCLSGNYCVDKKAAAINWIEGRGRSVVADCTLPATVLLSILKTTAKQMAEAAEDPAQVVSSSMCSTRMEATPKGDLYVSCTMPCIEVGTVGGGTILRPQNECLQMLSCAGPSASVSGLHACRLAEIICSAVLAGELSLMAALVTDQLVSSHMKLNR